jgi:hypothetical protein
MISSLHTPKTDDLIVEPAFQPLVLGWNAVPQLEPILQRNIWLSLAAQLSRVDVLPVFSSTSNRPKHKTLLSDLHERDFGISTHFCYTDLNTQLTFATFESEAFDQWAFKKGIPFHIESRQFEPALRLLQHTKKANLVELSEPLFTFLEAFQECPSHLHQDFGTQFKRLINPFIATGNNPADSWAERNSAFFRRIGPHNFQFIEELGLFNPRVMRMFGAHLLGRNLYDGKPHGTKSFALVERVLQRLDPEQASTLYGHLIHPLEQNKKPNQAKGGLPGLFRHQVIELGSLFITLGPTSPKINQYLIDATRMLTLLSKLEPHPAIRTPLALPNPLALSSNYQKHLNSDFYINSPEEAAVYSCLTHLYSAWIKTGFFSLQATQQELSSLSSQGIADDTLLRLVHALEYDALINLTDIKTASPSRASRHVL